MLTLITERGAMIECCRDYADSDSTYLMTLGDLEPRVQMGRLQLKELYPNDYAVFHVAMETIIFRSAELKVVILSGDHVIFVIDRSSGRLVEVP